ncbi:hypothetical protein O3P69_011934 [Scylla paramamosain]|uniref:Uncharacterized protein n=1 Tax=Scylla paramamosain TaxID=85552 RepID=A0AAW0SFQ1_SCYPA
MCQRKSRNGASNPERSSHRHTGKRPRGVSSAITKPSRHSSQLLTGRRLRDAIPVESSRYLINEQWGRTLRDQERAMIQTSVNSSIRHDQQAHSLTPLRPGQRARIQNPSSRRWDRVGTVLELSTPRQYLLQLDGSGRASIWNRRHLRPLTGEPQLSDDSTESPTPVRVTTPRPRRTQRAPRHLDDYFLNSPVRRDESGQETDEETDEYGDERTDNLSLLNTNRRAADIVDHVLSKHSPGSPRAWLLWPQG